MPVETTVREEWATLIRKLMNGDTPIKFAAKIGVSDTYVRRWLAGVVPTEVMVNRIAENSDADLHALRVAAGYDKPDTDAILDNVLVRVKAKGQLTEADLKLLNDLLDEARQKLK